MGLYNPRNKITDRRRRNIFKAGTCRNITIITHFRFTDTWGIVDQTYNANCPEILRLKLHNKHVCDNIAGGPANISRGPRKQLPWAIHRYLRNPLISAQSMDT